MIVLYRIWLRDRETNKRSCFVTTKFFVNDMLETAHDLMLHHSDYDFSCYRVDLVEITDFTL